MAEKIHIRNASGELESLTEKPFQTEDLLQKLIGQHPELLAGDQMRPNDPLRWILIRREMPIEGWALDHLLIDQHARPTLVEVKRGSNREIRREVVGQMLDYAANATSVWSERDMRRIFEENSDDPDSEIGSLLQEDEDPDIDGFWEQVATNLAANRLRLLFVADQIPNELERVVKFLNEYTRDNLEVLAVEVKQYPGRFGDALVSRVIGQVDATGENLSKTRNRRLTDDEFLASFRPDVGDAIKSMMTAAVEITGDSDYTFRKRTGGRTIRVRSSLWDRPIYLGLLHLPDVNNGDGSFIFHADLLRSMPSAPDYPPALRSVLEKWIGGFKNDTFGTDHQSGARIGREINADDFVVHIDLLTERLCGVLSELSAL